MNIPIIHKDTYPIATNSTTQHTLIYNLITLLWLQYKEAQIISNMQERCNFTIAIPASVIANYDSNNWEDILQQISPVSPFESHGVISSRQWWHHL